MLFSRGKTYVMDFATLADGRVAGLAAHGLLSGRIIIPNLEQYVEAESALLNRARDTVAKLGKQSDIKLLVAKSELAGDDLLAVARRQKAHIISAAPRERGRPGPGPDGVTITRLDDLLDILKPVYLPGSEIHIKVVKKGKDADEGIGYLDGGIKVVVDDGAHLVGKEAEVVIEGALDTAVGRVVFARPKYVEVR
jgi:uncharacterized protein YacL